MNHHLPSLKRMKSIYLPSPPPGVSHFYPAAVNTVTPSAVAPPPPRPALDWKDYVFRYDEDARVLRVFFMKTPKEMDLERRKLIEGVCAFLDTNSKKIRYLEIAEDRLAPHTFNTTDVIEDKPSLQLSHHYDPYGDVFEIALVSDEWMEAVGSAGEFWNEQDEKDMIIFDVDGRKRIMGFRFLDSSSVIAKN